MDEGTETLALLVLKQRGILARASDLLKAERLPDGGLSVVVNFGIAGAPKYVYSYAEVQKALREATTHATTEKKAPRKNVRKGRG